VFAQMLKVVTMDKGPFKNHPHWWDITSFKLITGVFFSKKEGFKLACFFKNLRLF